MNVKKFSDAMSEIDDRYIDEAINYKGKSGELHRIEKSVPRFDRWYLKKKVGTGNLIAAAVTVCIALVLLTVSLIVNRNGNQITLSDNSSNVTVRYTSNPFIFSGNAGSSIKLTEEELFTNFDTAIFKGTVSKTRNIVVNFNGEKEYRAIAQIEVEKVYRGNCSEGDSVTVMLPCPLSSIIRMTGTTTLSAMKEGVTGIFMPMVYDDESSLWMENGARLDKRDLADYGFADGERYVFLETDAGLIFDRGAYDSIADVTTLDDVEKYIENMLERLYGQGTE